MISAGNDIVSLNAINIARTKQYRFHSKVLSPTEKALYNQAAFTIIPFENFVWLLWSIKESAYKYLKRDDPGLVFIPVKFVVTQLTVPLDYALTNFEGTQAQGAGFDKIPALKGTISFGTHVLRSASLMYRELVTSVVNSDEHFENIYWGVKLIGRNDAGYQSTAVRAFLLARVKNIFDFDGLAITKNLHGIPVVLKGDEELSVAVSLSHHERFVGYSFRLGDS